MSNKSKLIIGISSRALFNLDKSHEIYEKEGLESYRDYQIANEEFSDIEVNLEENELYIEGKSVGLIRDN